MAGSKTNYLEDAVLRLVFQSTPITLPGTLYLALSTAPYSDTGLASEVVGNAYTRAAVARTSAAWQDPSGSPTVTKNKQDIAFPVATGSWGTVQSFYIMDAQTGGNALYGADLATPKSVLVGDAASFYANTLTVSED